LRARRAALFTFVAAAACIGTRAATVANPPQRTELRAGELLAGWSYPAPLSLGAYAPSAGDGRAADVFEGRLTLHAGSTPLRIRVLRDDYRSAASGDSAVSRLPDLDLDFVQHDDQLIPARTGTIASSNPYWEYVIGAGRVWREPGDRGYTRASLPFALVEVNANCVHNGVLSFLFRADGHVSKAAYQVSSETCAYFKADLWGLLDATYTPHPVQDRDAMVAASRFEFHGRLPRRPTADLARDYPGVDIASFAHPDDVKPADLTTWGVVAGGIHYAGGCPTRAGEYPYCDQIVLPSYSLAKSVFAALALMRLERLHPGARLERVADHVPECRGTGSWTDVSLENLLDMASGNYLSAADHGDEYEPGVDAGFFIPATRAGKIDYACNRFPHREPPGARFVYRSSDTFILGSAMSDIVRRDMGVNADLVADLVAPGVWRPAGLGPGVEVVRRTRDAAAQPLTGYGLLFQPDDVAKLARFFETTSELPGRLLDPAMFRAAMQRDPGDRGLPASPDASLLYNNGFWAARVAGLPGCTTDQYIPFMSGYGGISVVLMPNDVGYYYFSDGGDFRFLRAVREAARIRPYCVPGPREPRPVEGRTQ
jgi:hypothetical protein